MHVWMKWTGAVVAALLVASGCASGESMGDDAPLLPMQQPPPAGMGFDSVTPLGTAMGPAAEPIAGGAAGVPQSTDTTADAAGGGQALPPTEPAPTVPAPTDGAAGADAPTPPTTIDDSHFIRGPDPTRDSATAEGPYNVESYTNGYADSPAYLDGTIWYPTDAEPPFAGVAIVPGFVSPQSAIAAWGPFYASHGIVAITIGTNSGGDPPEVRAEALLAAVGTLRSEHERAGGPLEGLMDTSRFAISGWSMGGGGTLIAAEGNPDLRAAIGLASWRPGGRFPANQVPTLLFAGTNDTLAGGQSQGFYSSIPETTSKMLFEVAGGSHSVANAPTGAFGDVGRYGLSWLKVFLEGDERYRQFLLEIPTTTADFESNL